MAGMTLFSRRRMLRTALAAGTLALPIAACSPSKDKAASNSGSAPASSSSGSKLVLAVQPSATAEQLSADAKDLTTFLSGRMNRPVDVVFPTTFAGVIESLRFGHAHAAFMSAWPLALARKHAGADVGLAEIREVVIGADKREEPAYYSYWIVRSDSPIQSMEQLRGKRAALPSQLSTSGYVAPVARLIELGLLPSSDKEAEPKKFFSEVAYAGGYSQCWDALRGGQVDATVIAGDVSEKLYREVLGATRVVEQQGPIPSHGVAFARQLDQPTKDKLKETLLALGEPQHRELMRKFISGIFVRFKATTAEEHLAALDKYLVMTGAQFTEKLK